MSKNNGETKEPVAEVQKQPDNYRISTNLLNGIIQYLGTRPYQEVVNLINGIQTECKPIKEDAKG